MSGIDRRKIVTPEREIRLHKMRLAKAQKALERKQQQLGLQDDSPSNVKLTSNIESDEEEEEAAPWAAARGGKAPLEDTKPIEPAMKKDMVVPVKAAQGAAARGGKAPLEEEVTWNEASQGVKEHKGIVRIKTPKPTKKKKIVIEESSEDEDDDDERPKSKSDLRRELREVKKMVKELNNETLAKKKQEKWQRRKAELVDEIGQRLGLSLRDARNVYDSVEEKPTRAADVDDDGYDGYDGYNHPSGFRGGIWA